MDNHEEILLRMQELHIAIRYQMQCIPEGTFSMTMTRQQWQDILTALEIAGEM